MSRNIGPTVEILLQRVRQTGGLAVDEDFATQIFTIAQQFTNAVLRRVFTSETLTTSKEKLLYSISSDLTNAIDIVSITESTRELVKCNSIADFSAYEQNWFRNITATRFEAWHQLSRDFFILYPGKASASSVTVEFVRQIPFIPTIPLITTRLASCPTRTLKSL